MTNLHNKKCIGCGEIKPLTSFCKDISRKDGLDVYCRKCKNSKYKKLRHHRIANGLCEKCGNPIEESETQQCLLCSEKHRIYSRRWHEDLSIKIGNYFENKCAICGLKSTDTEIFDLHHLDPATKKYDLSHMRYKDWGLIIKPELDKCSYLCALCHRRLHAGRFDLDMKAGKLVLKAGKPK